MSENHMLIFGGAVSILLPEGFLEMSEQEVTQAGGRSCNNGWTARNAGQHMMVEITWSKVPLFGSGVPLNSVVANTERTLQKRCGNYRKLKEMKTVISGQEASGLRYTYTAQGIEMESEYILIKYQKKYYAFSLLARMESFEEQYPVFEKMLDSVELR